MKRNLLIVIFFIATLLSADFVFAQVQISNKTTLPNENDLVAKKIAFIDSVRKSNKTKEQQDHIFYKSLTEQGFTRRQVDSLHKVADPNFIIPVQLQNNSSNDYQNPNAYKWSNTPVVLTTGPEQDCMNGIQVCATSYTQNTSYTGFGTMQEVYNTCLLSDETYSVWYIFTVQSGNTFDFTINTNHDYDWAIYDLTAIGGCSHVPTSAPVTCNYSGTYGNTGISTAMGGFSNNTNAAGIPWNADLPVVMGHTYAMIVNNYSMDLLGYTLTFGGNAVITDNVAPTITSAINNCNNTVTLNFSKPITIGPIVGHPNIAASLDADGSDFNITPAGFTWTTTSVGNGNMASQAILNLTGTPASGVYTITVKNGNDLNTLLDHCGNAMAVGTSITFNYLGAVTASASPASVCAGGSSNLSVSNLAGATYVWTPSAGLTPSAIVYNPVATPNATTEYQCAVTYGGCTGVGTTTVAISPTPIVSISPMNPVLCSGTTSLVASSTNCTGCVYTWAGPAPAPSTGATLVGAGAGSFTVTASSTTCGTSTVSTTVFLASALPANYCSIYYVTTAGGAAPQDGSSIATAANASTLPSVMTAVACNGATIKMATGTYTLSNPLTLPNNVTIEGGYDNLFQTKSSAAGTTTITRNTSNIEGTANVDPRITALICNGISNFRLQDLTITTSNAPVASTLAGNNVGISTYGIYINSCSNYNIVRCQITPGTGGTGGTGTTGVGTYGGDTPGTGGGGGGSAPDGNCGGSGSQGNLGNAASSGAGGGSRGPTCNSSGCNFFGCSSNGCTAGTGGTGGTGAAGTAGAAGSTLGLSTATYQPAGQAGAGNHGFAGGGGGGGGGGSIGTCCTCGCGGGNANGGIGGSGGRGGLGGTGGYGGGGSFSIFVFSNGANGSVIDCQMAATAGAGGAGGAGAGGVAGAAGAAGTAYGGCNGGQGGNGGTGGTGGVGGAGGTGGTGAVATVAIVSGSNVTYINNGVTSFLSPGLAIPPNFSLTGQPVIVAGDATLNNINCTGTIANMNMTTVAATPTWTLPGGTPASGSGATLGVYYAAPPLGRENVVMNANTYTGFNNIITTPPSAGSILASLSSGCPGTYNFQSSLGSTPGFTFAWSANTVSGNVPTVATPNSSSSNITFPNNTGGSLVFTVSLTIKTECCGALAPITFSFTADALPSVPTAAATASPICPGSCSMVSATAPANCSFEWYNASTAGTLLYSGANYSVCPSSSTNYYVQTIGPSGCVSATRALVAVTVTASSPPSLTNVSSCSSGQTMTVNAPVGGATYNWYNTPCVGSPPYSGFISSGIGYTSNALVTTTYYVSVILSGCNESACTPVTMTITGSPISVTWNGTHSGGTNNWFDNLNWTPNCLPVCGTNVNIPSGTPNSPDIGFSPAAPFVAACQNFTLASGATLNFSDNKAELNVCGDFTQSGAITSTSVNHNEKIVFMGTVAQHFAKTSTATGNFQNVVLNNTASPPLLTIMGASGYQDMIVSQNFMFQNGIVLTEGVRKLVINNNASTSLSGYGVNSYVNGRITRAVTGGNAYDFPVGNSPVGATVNPYELMNINFASVTANYLTVSFSTPPTAIASGSGFPLTDDPPQNPNYTLPLVDVGGTNTGTGTGIGGVWTVFTNNANNTIYEPATSTAASYTMTLYGTNYNTASFPSSASNYYSFVKRSPFCPGAWKVGNVAGDGTFYVGSNNGSLITATRTGLSGFSQFATAKNTVPLPVDLVAFDATCVNHNTVLSWITATESNNNYFTLERSCDENFFQYQTIATIPGAGNSSTIKQYSFTDKDSPGSCYYRLSQTDYNGAIAEFTPITINCKENPDFNFIGTLPNPADNELNVIFTDIQSENVELTITDMLGQAITTKTVSSEPGLNKVTLDVTNFSAGLYMVKLSNDNKSFIKKIVKKK